MRKINTIDKPLAPLVRIEERRHKFPPSGIKEGSLQRLQIGKYHQQSYASKLNHSDKMDKFLKTHMPKITQEGMDKTNIPIAILEIESEFKNFPTKGTPGPNDSNSEFSQTCKVEIMCFHTNSSKKFKRR